MKKVLISMSIVVILVILAVGCVSSDSSRDIPEGTVRIACVGDSITYGAFVLGRKENCYPAKLQGLLGDGYVVRNYGVNAHAMLKTSDKPYWGHKYFKESQEFAPDIVLIMLGTNDSKRKNWTGMDDYLADYRDMVATYRQLPSRPAVFLLTPPAAYGDPDPYGLHYSMDLSTIVEMGDALKSLGAELGLQVIDTYVVTKEHPDFYIWDGIHPNRAGAEAIADVVYGVLSVELK